MFASVGSLVWSRMSLVRFVNLTVNGKHGNFFRNGGPRWPLSTRVIVNAAHKRKSLKPQFIWQQHDSRSSVYWSWCLVRRETQNFDSMWSRLHKEIIPIFVHLISRRELGSWQVCFQLFIQFTSRSTPFLWARAVWSKRCAQCDNQSRRMLIFPVSKSRKCPLPLPLSNW